MTAVAAFSAFAHGHEPSPASVREVRWVTEQYRNHVVESDLVHAICPRDVHTAGTSSGTETNDGGSTRWPRSVETETHGLDEALRKFSVREAQSELRPSKHALKLRDTAVILRRIRFALAAEDFTDLSDALEQVSASSPGVVDSLASEATVHSNTSATDSQNEQKGQDMEGGEKQGSETTGNTTEIPASFSVALHGIHAIARPEVQAATIILREHHVTYALKEAVSTGQATGGLGSIYNKRYTDTSNNHEYRRHYYTTTDRKLTDDNNAEMQ